MAAETILYVNPLSPYAQKCAIALHEKGVVFERIVPASYGTGDDDPAHLALNPLGEVPTLIDGETTLFDSAVIFDYIDVRWAEPPLHSPDPAKRARALQLQVVLDNHYDPLLWGLTELLMLRGISGAEADSVQAHANRQAAKVNAWLTRQLSDSIWFGGDAFGAADIFAVVHLNVAMRHGLISPQSQLAEWLARANQRQAVLKEMTLANAFMASLTGGDIARWQTIRRSYRGARLEWVVATLGGAFIEDTIAAGKISLSRDIN